MVTVRCGARWFMVNAGHSRLTLTVAAGSGFTAAAAAVAVFMARQSAACLSLQAADSERCLFGGDCCHSIRHLCAVPGYMRQTIRRCTVRLQKLYRQTSDVVPSDLATLYRQTSDAVPSYLRRRLRRGFQLIIATQSACVNENFAGCYSLMGRFTASSATAETL